MHELMNGDGYALFKMDPSGLDKNTRTKFQFALKGRGGKGGVLKELRVFFLDHGLF